MTADAPATLTITRVGGPTALIELAGLRLLTDPTFDPGGGSYPTPVSTLRKRTGPAVPADAVTASGSGLDPQISPAYAAIQVARVAAARSVAPAEISAAVRRHTTGRALGFLGEPTVNVIELNLDLDDRFPVRG